MDIYKSIGSMLADLYAVDFGYSRDGHHAPCSRKASAPNVVGRCANREQIVVSPKLMDTGPILWGTFELPKTNGLSTREHALKSTGNQHT